MQKDKDNLMDFKVLSRYDDLFTAIFLDNLFLWFNTIKMNNDHRRPRVPNNKILEIIQTSILEKSKPTEAVNDILEMDYFKHYLHGKNQKQVQEFIQHMKRYLYMYMPNAGYEVGDTKRYGGNGRKIEACLVATKDWHSGDEMRLLTGMIACLDPKDDAELKKGNRDFSVMWSTRKNCSCLFLGPARFANHDCESNCRFISSGQNSIIFKVIKDIKFGEEITVYYGKHYFGENNCECRCITCEKRNMGHFALHETDENYSPMDIKEEDQGSTTRRSTRKRKPTLHEDYSTLTNINNNNTTTTTTITPRRLKRASIEPSPRHHSIDSLEELIGEEEKQQILKERKKEDSLPPMPVSPTTEGMQRLKVMSIGFLCGSDEEMEDNTNKRRVSDCPYLDLLVDAAVMDAEYSNKNNRNQQITVVVNPEIHRDATNRVLLQQQQQQKRNSSPLIENNNSDSTKADSAISLSPKEEYSCWRQKESMDDMLKDDEERAFDEFCDDVSDLSSVNSSFTSDTEEEEEESEIEMEEETKKKKSLFCIACSKPLQDVSEQIGPDLSITNELATWTWSPSAIFTDWNPKRCPRCERHFTIFKQEWPNRKIKKKRIVKKKKAKKLSLLKNNSSRSASPLKTTTNSIKQEDIPPPIIFSMQDDPEDLNYIPPSPLSEIVYE